MMRPEKIHIDIPATLGPPPYFLCEILEDWEFKDKKRTDNLLGYKYVTAFPELALERIAVKIPGKKLIELQDGEIAEISFENLELKAYATEKRQLNLSAKATGISVISDKKG